MLTTLSIPVEPLDAIRCEPYGWMLGKPVRADSDTPSYISPASDFWREHLFDTDSPGETEILWVIYRNRDDKVTSLELHRLTQVSCEVSRCTGSKDSSRRDSVSRKPVAAAFKSLLYAWPTGLRTRLSMKFHPKKCLFTATEIRVGYCTSIQVFSKSSDCPVPHSGSNTSIALAGVAACAWPRPYGRDWICGAVGRIAWRWLARRRARRSAGPAGRRG
ncbi:hypothetical protein R54767_02241 [Paraburkholderia gardini]|uniref:Uncharacterized protein n=1 Tax=Paraburkholderia gardini TaxID=2823469 RepID=A0ABM8U358_9BURK|nr:hypothetical protein R54767_02241 [Paraburkholderia gardini]